MDNKEEARWEEESPTQRLQKEAAGVLSHLKNTFKASERAVTHVISGVNKLNGTYLDVLKVKLEDEFKNQDGYITLNKIHSFLDTLRGQSLFEGVSYAPALESFVERLSSNCPVKFLRVVCKKAVVIRKGVHKMKPIDFGYVVDFLPQMQQNLNIEEILHCVDNPREVKEGKYCSVTDGLFYRSHPIVLAHGNKVLAVQISADDVEVTDACKSKTKLHRLRLYYWTLGNVYPELRSSLKAINLIAIVKTSVAKKYGNEPFLKNFLQGMRALSIGVSLDIHGVQRIFYGMLASACADLPAAANLGGFKESHFAVRPCRTCMVTRKDLCKCFSENIAILRTKDHEKFLQLIEASGDQDIDHNIEYMEVESGDDDEITMDDPLNKYQDHQNPSINYGINSRSVLMEAPYFDVTKCLPHDFLHTIPEGCLDRLCRFLLKDACFPPAPPGRRSIPLIPFKDVNGIIQEMCDLGLWNKKRPSIIKKNHLSSKLKQSAAQILVLGHILPFILKGKLPDEKLELLRLLLSICNICMAFELDLADLKKLEELIQNFIPKCIQIYPKIETIKLHTIVHFVLQIRLLGPPRQNWCFRYEAMHNKFTDFVRVIHNAKNIAKSLGKRHLNQRNAEIMDSKKTGKFLNSDDVKILNHCVVADLPSMEKECLLQHFEDLQRDTIITRVKTL